MHSSCVNAPLAKSEIWSDLLSLIVVLLLFGLPAILRAIGERVAAKPKEQTETDKVRMKAIQQKRHALTEKTREKFMSDWDRRQQLIRQRLNQLKEKESAPTGYTPPAARPQQPPRPPDVEQLPVAMAIPEHRPVPPPTPVQRPRIIQPSTVSPVPPVSPPKRPAAKQPLPIRRLPAPTSAESTIAKIIRTTSPLKAAILIKEILDKPAALRPRSDYW